MGYQKCGVEVIIDNVFHDRVLQMWREGGFKGRYCVVKFDECRRATGIHGIRGLDIIREGTGYSGVPSEVP